MKNENNKRKYGHGDNRKDGQLIMRTTKTEDNHLRALANHLGKSKSEGGDDILNRPPKNNNAHFSLAKGDLDKLSSLSKDLGVSESDIVRKAIELLDIFNGMK